MALEAEWGGSLFLLIRADAHTARRSIQALGGMTKLLLPSIFMLLVSVLAAGLSAASGLRFWWAFVIVAVAVLVNGFVATLEDHLPGGFSNPDGTSTPHYVNVVGWVLRAIGAVLLLLCIVAFALFYWG